jgi:hypothetical protein
MSVKFLWLLTLRAFLLLPTTISAQNIQNVRYDQNGKVIIITYDLSELENGKTATISLFCSQDGGKTWGEPLKKVTGAIGENIKPGKNNKITWDVLSERDKLVGDITFKLEALNVPALKENTPGKQSGSNEIQQYGNGISYDLGGRGARSLPKPTYNSAEQGKIVVSIKVNRQGQVTYASAGAKGTTIYEINLVQNAENAARKTVFEPDADAPEEQRGTITYVFVKQR